MSDAITSVTTPFSFLLSWADIPNYDHYSVQYKLPSDTLYTDFDLAVFYNSCLVHGLTPETEYIFRVYSNVAGTKTLEYQSNITTSSASVSNVNKTAFAKGTFYNVAPLTNEAITLLGSSKAAVISTLFNSNEVLETSTSAGKFNTTLLKLNSSTKVLGNQKIYIPFDDNYSGSQSVSFVLADNSTSEVSYTSSTNSISVNGTDYIPGEKFVFDGKLVTVASA